MKFTIIIFLISTVISAATIKVHRDFNMIGNEITNIFAITLGGDRRTNWPAFSQTQITNEINDIYVNVSGDTMFGDLGMSGNSITNLATPSNQKDAATKEYVDDITNAVIEYVENNKYTITKTRFITSDYTLVSSDQVLFVNTTDREVVITLPYATNFPSDGYLRQFDIMHNMGSSNVQIKTTGTERFAYGNSFFNLGKHIFSFTIGTVHVGANAYWGLRRNLTVSGSAHREASWASANFSSMTAIPFDNTYSETQYEIINVRPTGYNKRITVGTAGNYELSYMIDIDSTGGGTWNATSRIYKNGVAVDDTSVRTGNYGNEDQSMCYIPTYMDLEAGDYLELRIDHNNLTGNLVHGVLNVKIML